MKKRMIYLAAALVMAGNAAAQQNQGGISQQMFQEIVKAQPATASQKAIANAIANNNIDDLARSRESQFPLRQKLLHRDSSAGHYEPETVGTLLDVQRTQCSACRLCEDA